MAQQGRVADLAATIGPADAARRLKAEWRYDATDPSHFGMSVARGEGEAVELFLAAGMSPDARHTDDPVLAHAVAAFHLAIAERLIEAGADVNATDTNGNTPLVRAVSHCLLIPHVPGLTKENVGQLIRHLLQAGADPNATFARGDRTAAQEAKAWCSGEIQALFVGGIQKAPVTEPLEREGPVPGDGRGGGG